MSYHIGHTSSHDWWIIDHNGHSLAGPFKTKTRAVEILQLWILFGRVEE